MSTIIAGALRRKALFDAETPAFAGVTACCDVVIFCSAKMRGSMKTRPGTRGIHTEICYLPPAVRAGAGLNDQRGSPPASATSRCPRQRPSSSAGKSSRKWAPRLSSRRSAAWRIRSAVWDPSCSSILRCTSAGAVFSGGYRISSRIRLTASMASSSPSLLLRIPLLPENLLQPKFETRSAPGGPAPRA